MSLFLRLKNRGLAALATAFPSLGERFAAGYRAERQDDGVPWVAGDKAARRLDGRARHHRRGSPPRPARRTTCTTTTATRRSANWTSSGLSTR